MLTPAALASGKFGLLHTLAVDGTVLAQPLLVSGLVFPDGTSHDVLVVVTGHDTVYAFDAQTYALLWQHSMGVSQRTADVGCVDVRPEYGISSTPVIVRHSASKATMYLVSASEPVPYDFHHWLHALDVATGNGIGWGVDIAPTATLKDGSTLSFSPQHQWNRASLAWANGSVYVGVGSHCDDNADIISGWLLRYDAKLNLAGAFHTIEDPASTELASIWMAGFAPAVDPAGNLYVTTGNGAFDLPAGGHDYGDSVLELSGDLATVRSTFTPATYKTLSAHDVDFASGGVMLLPSLGSGTPPLAVAMGKDAVLYLLNRNKLGGLKANDAGALQATRLATTSGGVFGGPAYYGGPAGPAVYYQINWDVLRAFRVNAGAAPSLTQFAQGTTLAGYGGSIPIVSSNGMTPGTGIVWLVRRLHKIQLEAYDADTLGKPLYAATAGTWSNPENNAFLTAMEANGRVYVGSEKTVSVFGLAP